MSCLEATLAELGVKQLVVAALTTVKPMWRDAFGYKPLTVEEAGLVEAYLVSPDPETCVMMRKPLGAQAAAEEAAAPSATNTRRAVATSLAQAAKRRREADTEARLACEPLGGLFGM
jgi:hypothetical protein